MDDEIDNLIGILKSVDTDEYYKEDVKDDDVRPLVIDAYNKLIELGEKSIDKLAVLTLLDNTWSSQFALEIMRKIKNPKCAPYFIRFLKNHINSDYYNLQEEAMHGLIDLEESITLRLIKTVLDDFENEIYNIYLVGAITEQKSEQSYNFLVQIAKDYIESYEKYKNWFWIGAFCSDFQHHKRKEAIPFLIKIKELVTEKHEVVEIDDTIKYLEDPEKYDKEHEERMKEIREMIELEKKPLKELVKGKGAFVHINDDNTELYAPLLFSIDSAILEFWDLNKDLKDIGVLKSLKNLKHNIYGEFDDDSLEAEIINHIKMVFRQKQFTEMEIISCISRLEKSVKFHREEFGSRGYLETLAKEFSEEESEENISS